MKRGEKRREGRREDRKEEKRRREEEMRRESVYVEAQKFSNQENFLGVPTSWQKCVLGEFLAKVFPQAKVKHTIYFEWPK